MVTPLAVEEARAGVGAATSGRGPDAVARATMRAVEQEAAKSESQLKLTPEQEERVKQAKTRLERQMRTIRERAVAYDAEPAFAFKVKAAPEKKK